MAETCTYRFKTFASSFRALRLQIGTKLDELEPVGYSPIISPTNSSG
jgi:hypothetical protein